MDKWVGKNALVTGASTGIGYAIVEALVKEGVNVIGCARNTENIEKLKNQLTKDARGSIQAIKCDVTKESEVLAMFKEIEGKYKTIHILVNNAGMAKPDDLLTGDTQKWKDMLDLNVVGLSVCTREGVKLMEKHGVNDGHIINVNSMAGHNIPPMPGTHFYAGTKHMVTALSKALVMELAAKKSAIRVTNLSPGAVDTEFVNNWIGKEAAENLKNTLLSTFKPLTASDIVGGIIYVLSAPPHVTIRELTIAPTQQFSF